MSFVLPDPGPPNDDFAQPAPPDRLERTVEALRGRGFHAQVAADGVAARQFVLDAVPEGAEVHTALSETLTELGIRAEIEESGRYDSVRAKLALLDRETQDREMRKLGAAPDYILGSAHAITDDGVVMVGSGSGSQLGAYAYAAGSVILIVGHQKLVRDIPHGLRRLREYALPREFLRMQGIGYPGSLLAKTLLIEHEPSGRITVVLVPETLGF
ncbi:MAG: lactate utilization protein [Actinomycetota bacterium]|nr:lactate utilization protein [Actinomycetota bacterium]